MKLALRLALACVLPAITACSILPSAGPSREEVVKSAEKSNPLGFKIVDVTSAIVADTADVETPPQPLKPVSGLPNKIGVDDVLQITIFESGLGLFSGATTAGAAGGAGVSGSATFTTLPPVTVGSDGAIAIPYVGRVHAAGVSVEDLREYIEDRLTKSKLASQPQVVVTLTQNLSNTVYVSGDVRTPGRYQLTQSPERLLDAITLAGSGMHLPFDTTVTLSRGDHQQRMALGAITALSPQNVLLESGDRIYLAYEPRTYTVYGAMLKPSEITFDTPRVTLAQALARASGLDDDKADPKGVYLFRFEGAEVAKRLGLDGNALMTPVVYHFDMKDPTTYFLVQQMELRNHDLIFVANAGATQLRKFLSLVTAPLTTAGSVANLAR